MDAFHGSKEIEDAFSTLVRAILKHETSTRSAAGILKDLALANDASKGDNCAAYEMFICGFRNMAINLIEIGIGGSSDDPTSGGGSLRMWRDYFSQARIFGIDLFDKSPHAADRIHVLRGSQDDADFLNQVARDIGGIDIIIDDGSHISAHVIKSFETLWPHLKSQGVYVVEDIATSYWTSRGGSRDVNDPSTSMNYFKRLSDGVNWPHSEGVVEPTRIMSQLEFIHFGQNFIVMRKL